MTGLGPVTGDRYTTGRAFATSDGHVKHISGWPECTASRRPPTDQLATPPMLRTGARLGGDLGRFFRFRVVCEMLEVIFNGSKHCFNL